MDLQQLISVVSGALGIYDFTEKRFARTRKNIKIEEFKIWLKT